MPFDLAITMAVWFKKIPFGRDKDPTDIVLCFILRDGTYSLSLKHACWTQAMSLVPYGYWTHFKTHKVLVTLLVSNCGSPESARLRSPAAGT